MATSQSPEQRELALVGKVEMRIALADSDGKLETILKSYLAPLLLKLASENESVRKKVITVCQHVNTRVKPASIQLPVAALVKQFKEQQNGLIRHFDLMYIQQGVDRMPTTEKAELLPLVATGISSSGSHGAQIFNLLLRLLESFTLPPRGSKEDVELRKRFSVSDEDAAYLTTWLGKFILFTPQKGTASACPGLSADDYAFISMQGKEDLWNPAAGGINLLRTKVLAARLLASGLFTDEERFLPALFASADTASNISDVGDDMMKRALPSNDLEDETLLKTLFGLYFGENGAPRVRPPLRLKILGLLNKSTHSTTFSNNIMKVVDDGIAGPSTDGEDVVMGNTPTSATAGREVTKLRTAIFQYINFVSRYGSTETLHAIASRVIMRLREFIDDQGWPKPGPNEDLVSRGYAYEVIGLLAKAGPRTVLVEDEHPQLDLTRWLFDSLARDASGNAITVSIEEALSTVLSALSRIRLAPEEQSVLEELLIDQMAQSVDLEANKRLRSTRYVSVRFANRCLPYSSVKARWIDILGMSAASDRPEVREEAERGLSPYWYRMLNGSLGSVMSEELTFPSFEAVMAQVFPGRTMDEETEPMAVAKQARRSSPRCFVFGTAFCRRILYHEAMKKDGTPPNLDTEWERRLDTAAESDEAARTAIRNRLESATADDQGSIETLLSALLLSITDPVTTVDASEHQRFVEFLSLSPDSLVARLASRTQELMATLKSNNHSRRMAAAQSFGILASHPAANAVSTKEQTQQLSSKAQEWQAAVGAAANETHGALVGLGFYYSRAAYRSKSSVDGGEYGAYLSCLTKIITEGRDGSLKEASHVAIGQLSMFGALSVDDVGGSSKIKLVTDKLYDSAKTGNETAILSLGQLSMILPEASDAEEDDLVYIEKQLYKLHEIRQAEVHFAVGEALSYVASGWRSTALATKLDIPGPLPGKPERKNTLVRVTDQILSDCGTTKPALKKAAVMWLLCVVQFCGQQPEIQQRLSKCQAVFKRCLGDRDELVQESASRGLGLVYEKGDRKLKDDLVRDLVSSFSSDRQSQLAGSVSADTQLFEPGQLPTGDGSVSTYKDIMSLASEVGDSSLVYRFMSMASSNAVWSSRAAFGRFGLSNVLSDSSVDGYLADNPKLYPKLFRYRFDPNGGVQRAMNDIWNALVKDSSATIDKYFDDIMEDLLVSILGKEWRVRQASCAAIADLVQGRRLEQYEKYLERIWTQCFKVLDDIKESVRAAASSLARVLTGVLTRALEADHSSTKTAAAMLKHVLPFLLSPSGMESSAKEVQAFAVHTLLEIIKKSNASTLRPFIPELVERLIGSLSTFEPEEVNYLHLNASKYNLTEQKIDGMRLSSIRASPLMEAIERCLDLLDDETMRQLQPKLEGAMKSAVGLPSKVGSSRILVSLSTRRLAVFRPFADAFLRLLEKLVLDRNDTVSSSYAVAAGYLARAATEKQLLRLVEFTQKLYFESEGDREAVTPRRAIASGEIVYATAKHATDRFNAIAASILPFVFVAKHDPNDHVKEQFQNAWDESVGGSRAVSLYLKEIMELCGKHLDSPQWVLKHTSARAVADAVTTIASLETQLSSDTAEKVWPPLEKALSGKTWDGKEAVLFGFVKFVQSAAPYYNSHPQVASAITKIIIREAKRQNAQYRQHAVKCFGQVALARSDIDMSHAAIEVTTPLFEAANVEPMEIDGAQSNDDVRQNTLAAAVESVLASINPAVTKGQALSHAITQALKTVKALDSSTAGVRRSFFVALKQVLDRVRKVGEGGSLDTEAQEYLRPLLFGPDPGSEALRLQRADAIMVMVEASPTVALTMRTDLLAVLAEEKSRSVRERLDAAKAALDRHGVQPQH